MTDNAKPTELTKVPPEAQAAWMDYDPPEFRHSSNALRHAFISGWLASAPQEPEMLSAVAKAWAEPLWNAATETCAAKLYLEADQLDDATAAAILRRVADDIVRSSAPDEPMLSAEEEAELVERINANPNLQPVVAQEPDDDAEWLRLKAHQLRLAGSALDADFSIALTDGLERIANRLAPETPYCGIVVMPGDEAPETGEE